MQAIKTIATQIKSLTNDYVIVQANLSDTNAATLTNAASLIQWSGGQPVPGNPWQRQITRTNSVETTVTATLGNSTTNLNLWVIWATVSIQMSGINSSPLSFTNILFIHSYPDDQLGVGYYYLGVFGLRAGSLAGITNYAAGKICAIATVSPVGVNALIPSGWDWKQMKKTETFVDGALDVDVSFSVWTNDGPDVVNLNKTASLDNADKLYSIDAPSLVANDFGATNSITMYKNFYDYVTYNGQICSDTNSLWYFEGNWNINQSPQVNSMNIGAGAITLP